jgi:hypothetical protein
MKALILAVMTAALAAAAGNGQNGRCTDIPITWSLSFTYDAGGGTSTAIYSDGAGGNNPSYSNGVDGVTAIIHTCSGTDDATVDTSGTTRSIGWNFGAVLATSSTSSCATNTPGWSGTSFYDHSFLNIRNILYTPAGFNSTQTYTFTTRMASQLNNRGTRTSNLFHMRMENPTVDAVSAPPADPTANCPYTDARIIVTHYPATSSSPETWVAYPDPSSTPAQVGTLLQDQTKGAPLNVGQYTMPFQFTISRK